MDIAVATRPVQPDDGALFRRLWPRLSPDTVYRRFHSPLHVLPPETVERLVTVDHDLREAVAAVVGGEVVGVARYDRSPATPRRPSSRSSSRTPGRASGLGRQLLRELVELAAARGVRTLTATVQPDNDRVIGLIRRLLPAATFTRDADVLDVQSRLVVPPPRRRKLAMTSLRTALARRRTPARTCGTSAPSSGRSPRPPPWSPRTRSPPSPPAADRSAPSAAGLREQANRNAGGTFSSEIRRRTDGKSRRSSDWISGEYWMTSAVPRGASTRGSESRMRRRSPGSSDVNGRAHTRTSARSPDRCFVQVLRGVAHDLQARVVEPLLEQPRQRRVDLQRHQPRARPHPGQDLAGLHAGARAELDDEPGPRDVAEVEHVPHRVPRRRQDRAHLTRVGGEGAQEAQPIGELLVHAASGPRSGPAALPSACTMTRRHGPGRRSRTRRGEADPPGVADGHDRRRTA